MKCLHANCYPIFVAVLVTFFCSTSSVLANTEITDSSQNGNAVAAKSKFSWNLFFPAILGFEPPPPPQGRWRPKNTVCCLIPSGKLTMYMTLGDTTLSSATTSCFSNPSLPAYVPIKPGKYSFKWYLRGPCSSLSGIHTHVIEGGYRYKFVLTYENGRIYIVTKRYDDNERLLDSARPSEMTKSILEIPSWIYNESYGQCSSVKME